MKDVLLLLEPYNKLCLRILPDFWGFPLSRTPEIEYAPKRAGLVTEERIRFSYTNLETYATDFSYTAKSPDLALFHLSAHALNRVFTLASNDRLNDVLLFTTHPTRRTALVEAVASVGTSWAIDHRHEYQDRAPEDGHAIVLKYYRVRKQQLENAGKSSKAIQESQRQYEDLRQMGADDFRQFVKTYSRA